MVDYFDMLGLTRSFAVDSDVLDKNYRDRSREVHPDQHVNSEAAERARALGATMDLNKAYKVLRKPQSRGEYLLGLLGVDIGDNEGIDASFLAEVLELREELDQALADGNESRLSELEESMLDRRDAILGKVAQMFAGFEQTGDKKQLEHIKRMLIELRYYARYLEQFDEDAGEAA